MPRTPQDVIRMLQQIRLLLKELSATATTGGDIQLSWFLDCAANFVWSAELRMINKMTISISPTLLDQRRESGPLSVQPGSKEGH